MDIIPIKVINDETGDSIGLSEYQVDDVIGLEHGGTGSVNAIDAKLNLNLASVATTANYSDLNSKPTVHINRYDITSPSSTWIITHNKPTMLLIPPYYANGHLCLSNKCVFHYKWHYKGKYIDSDKQKSYRWNDPKIKIKWPIKRPNLSKRDKKSKLL